MLLGGSLSPLWAYTPVAPPSAWQTTPVMSEDVRPNYQFQSTSAYATASGRSTMTPVSSPAYASRPRRTNWDDPEDEDALGVLAPVGEPLVLLVLAMLYLFKKNIVLISKSTNFKKILKK